MGGRIMIAAFEPLEGKEQELIDLSKRHFPLLRAQGLVTEREPILMHTEDGIVVEVFEWESPEAAERAYSNPMVQEFWSRLAKVCKYLPVGQVKQCREMFADFTPLN